MAKHPSLEGSIGARGARETPVSAPRVGSLPPWPTQYAADLSANTVTLVSGAITLAGILALMLWEPSLLSGIVASALLCLGFAFDSADGQLARLTKQSSAAGEWLDHLVDTPRWCSSMPGC